MEGIKSTYFVQPMKFFEFRSFDKLIWKQMLETDSAQILLQEVACTFTVYN